MNTQEFAEWLRSQADIHCKIADAHRSQPATAYACGYHRGAYRALDKVLEKLADLTTLDSRHDLPSTKGQVATTPQNAS